ncbi:hypothetical protein F2P79_017282 [Pimephales promelas]|nr:hypothetical protein F2P79_017282 [Pimephales promelas]KAG1939318.1 hypothetical protein F2P79_017282 [Pimephales promelas]
MDLSYANYFPSVSAVISGRLSREKWRSSTSVCRSCCTARGSERHQAEVLKKFYRSLIETVCNTSPEATIIVSGPLTTYRQGQESDACGETTQRLWRDDSACELLDRRRTRSSLASFSPAPTQHPGSHSGRREPGPELEPLRRPELLLHSSRVGTRRHRDHGHVPEILNGDERVGAVVLNVGANDIRLSDACGETTRRLWAISCWIGGGRDHLWLHSLWHDTKPWTTQRKTRAKTRARTSLPPLPVFEISTRNRFSPLRESERDDAVIIGTSIIRHVRATSGS